MLFAANRARMGICGLKKLENKISYTLMRFGVVLKKQQGLLKKLELPYKLGLTSILGKTDNKQSVGRILRI